MSDDPKFDAAVAFVLRHEGAIFVDDPADPGGASKFGISLLLLRTIDPSGGSLTDTSDVATLTEARAAQIYRVAFWDRYGYGAIEDAAVAAKVFDFAVNMGPHEAALVLQRALRACFPPPFALVEDGVLGAHTLDKTNLARPSVLRAALKSEAAGYYRGLAAERLDLRRYLDGWLNRAYDDIGAVS